MRRAERAGVLSADIPGSQPARIRIQLGISSNIPMSAMQASSESQLTHGYQRLDREPYYLATGSEIDVFSRCHQRGLPVMLKGPTGCGKTRFVEHMAWKLGRPLVTI